MTPSPPRSTVTQLRAAIRKLLVVLGQFPTGARRRGPAGLARDDYHSPGKPPCRRLGQAAAREALVDELVHDALAALGALDGAELSPPARDAADLLALVAGQDVEQGSDGRFRIAKKVAKDRVISTVDTEARHRHESANRHFDGYKAHICIDPGSELIDEVAVTPANAPDAQAVDDLLASHAEDEDKPEVVGDSAYGSAAARSALEAQGYAVTAKAAPVRNSTGGFTKEDFVIDLGTGAVTCPAGQVAPVRYGRGGEGKASFKRHCRHCPLKSQCTPSHRGRTISVHPQEALLRRVHAPSRQPPVASPLQSNPANCRAQGLPFTRRPWGGRKARVREPNVSPPTSLLALAALNWARLANLGLVFGDRGWAFS